MMQKNIFLDVLEGKIPADRVYEDDACIAFRDKFPQAPVHILIIPRKEVRTHADLTEEDCAAFMGKLHWAAVQIAKKHQISDYRLVMNCGEGSGQSVPHLHLHLMAGRDFGWPPG
ncbi:MAG: histidine triad nucleotide-binding protein [Planctomycetia bacterium]